MTFIQVIVESVLKKPPHLSWYKPFQASMWWASANCSVTPIFPFYSPLSLIQPGCCYWYLCTAATVPLPDQYQGYQSPEWLCWALFLQPLLCSRDPSQIQARLVGLSCLAFDHKCPYLITWFWNSGWGEWQLLLLAHWGLLKSRKSITGGMDAHSLGSKRDFHMASVML